MSSPALPCCLALLFSASSASGFLARPADTTIAPYNESRCPRPLFLKFLGCCSAGRSSAENAQSTFTHRPVTHMGISVPFDAPLPPWLVSWQCQSRQPFPSQSEGPVGADEVDCGTHLPSDVLRRCRWCRCCCFPFASPSSSWFFRHGIARAALLHVTSPVFVSSWKEIEHLGVSSASLQHHAYLSWVVVSPSPGSSHEVSCPCSSAGPGRWIDTTTQPA